MPRRLRIAANGIGPGFGTLDDTAANRPVRGPNLTRRDYEEQGPLGRRPGPASETLRERPHPRLTLAVYGELLPVRAFVFTASDRSDFDEEVQRQMAADGVRRYLQFIAMSDQGASDGKNVFAVLECNSREQAELLAETYFGSSIGFGVVMGPLGLKWK